MDYSTIKAIYFDSTEIITNDILWGLVELGVQVKRSDYEVTLDGLDPIQVQKIIDESRGYDYIFTQNFSVNVAQAAHENHIKYISWIYDSPQITLYTDCALYPENYIFSFDRKQAERLKAFGVPHAMHQPLASNPKYISTIKISNRDRQQFGCDMSFVGQLYQKEFINQLFQTMPEAERELFLKLSLLLACKWGDNDSIFRTEYDDIVSFFSKYVNQDDYKNYHTGEIYTTGYLLISPFVSHYERVKILSAFPSDFANRLYTKASDVAYANTFFNGTVYPPIPRNDSYKVFASSRLNLNTTLRSIETGIPLRIFDIMSVGGAVISNYQSEIPDLFEEDKEIILYRSPEEFVDKSMYYLTHEKERAKIALHGRNKVLNEYNCTKAIASMLDRT